MSWYVYLLRCADDTLYCGITRDLERRVREHNGDIPGGAKYTRPRRPVNLAAWIAAADKSEALRLELRVKALPRARKLKFFEQEGEVLAPLPDAPAK